MRPKFLSLLAVSVLALVGCSAAEPAKAPESSPAAVVSDSPKPTLKKTETANPNAVVEEKFAKFAVLRAEMNGVKKAPKSSDTIEALYDLCESGKPINVSSSEDLNRNLTVIGEDTYCDMLK
ncbi:hypothetical protein FQA45_00340 [Glutamicibacter halophytocola]|uniref:DUF732 domain-containing protein n=1 Tax=Glutamicibacter halophytocola TaxID=1933880 RepID=A0ABX5Y461_9MICC|nr:hypothetical protein [Glutamicibacter halophytocola]QDY64883.1 hypothetical protein FQA45_00340 [Glutamicibacter halophytocola]